MTLAILGGKPVATDPWPAWPSVDPAHERILSKSLHSGRWACSGLATDGQLQDRSFSEAFASYLDIDHCVATDHGSSALVMALEALGIGVGDEVIVPGLTWSACATAVLRVNAKAVLVDVDPQTLCLDADAVEAAITARTAGILMVHLYSCMADIDRIRAIASRNGLFLIEDAAQAHGAHWAGRQAGTHGDIGVFSMQQGKVMTCGEGGAAVTGDARLGTILEQLRNDGRMYCRQTEGVGPMELVESAGILGANRAPSEFQSSLMIAALNRLEDETLLRAKNAARLDSLINDLLGCKVPQPYERNSRRAYYHYPVRIDPEAFAGRDADAVSAAISMELGTWVHPPYVPLSRNKLATARRSKRYAGDNLGVIECPEALVQCEDAASTVLLFHHPLLLATDAQLEKVPLALEKVRKNADQIPKNPAS